jgi:hypothetical protein
MNGKAIKGGRIQSFPSQEKVHPQVIKLLIGDHCSNWVFQWSSTRKNLAQQ